MKLLAFGIFYWRSQSDAQKAKSSMVEWKKRLDHYLDDPDIFITSGTYSDPKYNPTNMEFVQIDLPVTKPYSTGWNYWKHGFLTGVYHAMLNKRDWDVLCYVHYNLLLGENLIPKLKDFYDTPKEIASCSFIDPKGTFLEAGLMFLKKDAVLKYMTTNFKPCLDQSNRMYIEEEMMELFSDSWYNLYPEIPTFRTNSDRSDEPDVMEYLENYSIDREQIPNLPFMFQTHFIEPEIESWKRKHPLP